MELTPLEREMVVSNQLFIAAERNMRAGVMLAEKLCTAIGVAHSEALSLWRSALLDTEEV